MFTKFGTGRLNGDGDQRGRLCGGGKILRFFELICIGEFDIDEHLTEQH